jgi:4-amino-4-deoxychorismate lyase
MLNERGEVVSATMANIFWVKDGTIHTPALSTGAIAGITRSCLIKLAQQHFIPLIEGVYEMSDLTDADEIFLTSGSLGMGIVTAFDFRTYSVAAGSVAAILREAFLNMTAQSS